MSWPYRCMQCRGRNTLAHRLEWYKRTPKCKHGCGCNRFYMDKARLRRTDYCVCEGYHHTHRIKSAYCVHNPNYELHSRVGRYGEDQALVLAEIAARARQTELELELAGCPF